MNRPLTLALALGLLTPAAPCWAQSKWAKHYHDRVAAFERENANLPAHKRYVVLLGSSSMEGWKYSRRLKRFLPNVPALNRGISADTIGRGKRGILNRLEASVFKSQPSHVFLMNGRNDLGRSKKPPVKATAATYEKVVAAIQKRLPNTIVCIVTCPPVNKGYAVMAPHLLRLNAAYKAIAKRRKCPLIDLHALLKGPDGLLPTPSLTRDGLHFLDKGYEVLGREIKRVLEKHPAKRAKTRKTPKKGKAPKKKTTKKPDTRQSNARCPRSAAEVIEGL